MATNETKRERFVRLAEARTNKILDMIKLLGNCSSRSNYEYTDEDVPGGSKKIKTGDDTNLVLPVAAFAGALILLVILIIKRKKK